MSRRRRALSVLSVLLVVLAVLVVLLPSCASDKPTTKRPIPSQTVLQSLDVRVQAVEKSVASIASSASQQATIDKDIKAKLTVIETDVAAIKADIAAIKKMLDKPK